MLCGYIPEEQWLLDIAKEQKLGEFSDDPEDDWRRAEAMKNALKHVIYQAGLGASGRFGYVNYKHEERMIIAVATSDERVRWPRPTWVVLNGCNRFWA